MLCHDMVNGTVKVTEPLVSTLSFTTLDSTVNFYHPTTDNSPVYIDELFPLVLFLLLELPSGMRAKDTLSPRQGSIELALLLARGIFIRGSMVQ